MRWKKLLLASAAGATLLAACATTGEVPYREETHYFVKNNLSEPPMGKFTSQAQLDSCFGVAAVMGPGGVPEQIDFSREFVIAVSQPVTSVETRIEPVSLRKNGSGSMVLDYRVVRGDDIGYFIQPCLLLVVRGSGQTDVELREIEKKR